MSYPELSPRSCKYGAPMGKGDWTPDTQEPIKMYLRKLEWVDGDYTSDGTYWGYSRGEHIYRACGYGPNELNEMFVRTYSRKVAKQKVLEIFPNARFYR